MKKLVFAFFTLYLPLPNLNYMKRAIIVLFAAILLSMSGFCQKTDSIQLINPILPNYYADPSVVNVDGTYYVYVTTDPWGADSLACWSTKNFKDWTPHTLNWPTKAACTTSLSNNNMVWAPSVIKRGNKYYIYVSVGSEIWCGVSSSPLGEWKNMLLNKPLVANDSKYYHAIDAEAFIDTDGRAYLYWGSGWDWKNGHCYVAELSDDMCSFKGEPVEVTPANYFEAPFMVKRGDNYFLMYSDGKTIDETYKVRYAVGNSPFGPFIEAENSPILQSDPLKNVYGPGHHSIMKLGNQYYILYHKHSLPFKTGTAMRQLCIDKIYFDTKNTQRILNVVPTDSLNFPNLMK